MPAIGTISADSGTQQERVTAFFDQLSKFGDGYTILFSSPKIDRELLLAEIRNRSDRSQIFGCTTAGEITGSGFREGAISGISFPTESYALLPLFIPDLSNIDLKLLRAHQQSFLEFRGRECIKDPSSQCFGLLLIDGMSVREESVVSLLSSHFPTVPIVGGSAGDDLNFGDTFILHQAEFTTHSALFLIFSTSQPFHCFKTHHLVASEERLVITKADSAKRLVYEMNGEPAAVAYRRACGLEGEAFQEIQFINRPLSINVGGASYIRSLKAIHPDASISFFCGIEEGLILRLCHSRDLVQVTQEAITAANKLVGNPRAILAFECILRRLEAVQSELVQQMEAIYRPNNVVGFHTYGEQYHSIHINQTLTAIAFGERDG